MHQRLKQEQDGKTSRWSCFQKRICKSRTSVGKDMISTASKIIKAVSPARKYGAVTLK